MPTLMQPYIPAYNGGAAFEAYLQSLESFLPSLDDVATEVMVVADGSDGLVKKFGTKLL